MEGDEAVEGDNDFGMIVEAVKGKSAEQYSSSNQASLQK